ncbi:hypothetical protein, partial [uncultured Roseibium sp.]|uniref:hypothetical protein n=1 Tax=uncultured Roseibium sp. TaxID=1936171 RepID=UPI0026359B9E
FRPFRFEPSDAEPFTAIIELFAKVRRVQSILRCEDLEHFPVRLKQRTVFHGKPETDCVGKANAKIDILEIIVSKAQA